MNVKYWMGWISSPEQLGAFTGRLKEMAARRLAEGENVLVFAVPKEKVHLIPDIELLIQGKEEF